MTSNVRFSKPAQDAYREMVKDPEIQGILTEILSQRQRLLLRVQAVGSNATSGSRDPLPSIVVARAQEQGVQVQEADVQSWLDSAAAGNVATA